MLHRGRDDYCGERFEKRGGPLYSRSIHAPRSKNIIPFHFFAHLLFGVFLVNVFGVIFSSYKLPSRDLLISLEVFSLFLTILFSIRKFIINCTLDSTMAQDIR